MGVNLHAAVDRGIGSFTRALQRTRPLPADSWGALDAYRGLTPARLFPPPSGRASCAPSRATRLGPFVSRTLRFESEHVPLDPDLQRVYRAEHDRLHVFRVREVTRASASPRRAVVYVHGWMETNEELGDVLLAPLLARALDADVFSLKLPHHWSRQLGGSPFNGALYVSADLVRTTEAYRQSVRDARTLVSALHARGTYDEVGVVGISLGGQVATLLACTEERLDWAAPLVSHLDLVDLLRHAAIVSEIRLALEREGVDEAKLAEWIEELGFARLAPVLPAERLMPYAGRDDQFMRAEAVERFYGRWDGVEVRWLPGGHITALLPMPKILADVKRRLDAFDRRRGTGASG